MANSYYAFDMVNGNTIIGRKDEEGTKGTNMFSLEEVVIIETLKTPYDTDIKQAYIDYYKLTFKNVRYKLPDINLEKNDSSSSGRPKYAVLQWYLGEDILKEENKIKGDI